MRRYLSKFEFTPQIVEKSIYDCLDGYGNSNSRWRRMDTAYFLGNYLIKFMNKEDEIDKHILARKINKQLCDDYTSKLKYKSLIECISRSIYHEIINKNIELSPIHYQMRLDSSSQKVRMIGLASIKQQVYDHIIVNVCRKMFMNKIGQYQCASVPKRGQLYVKSAIESWIRMNPKKCRWIWKGDVRKFYPSISHDKLKNLLRRDIKNDDVLYVVFYLIDTYGDKGLCIGSYLSQFLANYYLSYAYHFLSEKCFTTRKSKRTGEVKQVKLIYKKLFYMDDIIIFSPNKKYLKRCVNMLFKYLNEKLGLTIKKGHQLFPLDSRPIDMMGYKIWTYKTIIRRRIFVRLNKILVMYKDTSHPIIVKIARSLISYKGYLDHTDSIKYKKKMKFERTFKNAKEVVKKDAKSSGIYRKATQVQIF